MSDELKIVISGDAQKAVDAINTVKDRVREMGADVVNEAAKMAAAWLSVEKALELAKESIGRADEIRDLDNSLTVFTGSAKKATEALEFFDKAQTNSRNTAEELARTYRDLLPTAISRGFSQESLQHITGWLSQLATISGKTLDEMEHGFQQLVSGRVSPGRNPLLAVLGVTKQDVDGLGWDQIVSKMQDVAGHFPEFGQSFESTMHKVKDDIVKYIGEGINEVTDHGALGNSLLQGIESAESVAALHNVGEFIGNILKGDIIAAISGGEIEKAIENAAHPSEWFKQTGGGIFNWAADAITGADLNQQVADSKTASLQRSLAINRGRAAANPSAGYDVNDPLMRAAGISPGGSGSDITGVTGGPGDLNAFYENLGHVLDAHKDKAQEIMASVRDEVHGGVISWTNYTSSIAYALSGTKEFDTETVKNAAALGEVAFKAEKASEYLKRLADVALTNAHAARLMDSDSGAMSLFAAGSFDTPNGSVPPEYAWAQEPNLPQWAYGHNELPQGKNLNFDLTAWDQTMSTNLTDQYKKAADAYSAQLQVDLEGELGDAFGNLFRRGAKGFAQQLEHEFDHLMDSGAKSLIEKIFGSPTQKNADGTFGPNHDATQGLSGGLLKNYPNADKAAMAGLGFASIGYSAYQSGLQGDTRAQSALSGGMAGAGLATGALTAGMGAVLGAAIGFALSQYALNQKRDDYQYAIPMFDANGNVILDRPSGTHSGWDKHSIPNTIGDAQAAQMTGQVQDTVDTYRNQYTRLLMTLGVSGSPFDGPALGGKIQDNPSAHFMEHFQQWMSQTLPREIAGQFKDELKGGFGNLGLSGSQFDSMWSKYQGLDPAKAASMLTGLADALKSMNDSGKFFGQSAGSRMFDLTEKNGQSFAESLDEGDAKILDFASHLKDLVGEDQINAAKELGQMETSRADAEKQFLQTVIATIKSAQDAAKALSQSLDVRLIHKADGSADYQGLANYYKSDADSAIAAFTGAKNPQDAQAAWNRFLADLDKVSQAGYGISTQTGDDFTKWAQQQIKNEQPIFDAVVQQMGDDMASRDAAFLAAIQPSIDDFKNSLGGANVVVGDFTGNIEGAGASLARLQKTVDGLNASLSGAAFTQRTVAARS